MNSPLISFLLEVTQAKSVTEKETLQTLWSGYGKIVRYTVNQGNVSSVIVKQIQLKESENHPRGWNSSIGHERKLKSYEVETQWYQNINAQCHDRCRTPQCLGVHQCNGEVLIVLEDLDASGYSSRKTAVTLPEVKTCLAWLANFHATFLGTKPRGLWEVGTYWHLATRPEELAALSDKELRKAAPIIDKILNECTYQTLVHGDAKLANFCFSENGLSVAAVDFQYVGEGCGMKDVAYFLGSCLSEQMCEIHEQELLNYYFDHLKNALQLHSHSLNWSELEKEWRTLFPVAWTDFHRFLKGWSPSHWKINSYSEKIARQVLKEFTQEKPWSKKMSNAQLKELAKVAITAAKQAGQYIASQSEKQHTIIKKQGGNTLSSQVVTQVDFKSQEIILSHILPTCEKHDLALLTEELEDDHSRLQKDHFWCIDPLDGTLPFTEGIDGYAVSIALVDKTGSPLIGIIYDPLNDNLYHAIKGQGCKKNGLTWEPKKTKNEKSFVFCSNRSLQKLPTFVRIKKNIDSIARAMGLKQVIEKRKAGSVMNAMWVLENAPGCYLTLPKKENGGGSIWDFAASACIFEEVGIKPIDCFGKPLNLNNSSTTFMNQGGTIYASSPELYHKIKKAVKAL